jgi:hypothetical protein
MQSITQVPSLESRREEVAYELPPHGYYLRLT